MTQPLTELVEQFCNFQRKQRGKTEGGVKAYRWNLEQFLVFIRNREGRLARVMDLTASAIQARMDDKAGEDLALGTMRVRQSRLPALKPHDLRHGVAMVRALLGHARIDTTQIYTSIRPPQLKRAVSFYEEQATKMLVERNERSERNETRTTISVASGEGAKPLRRFRV
jgi:site-specific recombinase XerD